jgi:hypothetical protein
MRLSCTRGFWLSFRALERPAQKEERKMEWAFERKLVLASLLLGWIGVAYWSFG